MAFDPDAFLAKKEEKETVEQAPTEKAEGFNVDAFLAKEDVKEQEQLVEAETKAQGPVAPSNSSIIGAVAPAVTGAAMATPTGAGQAGKVITSAVAPYVKEVARGYMTKPVTAIADAVLMGTGLPPMVGPAQGFMDRATAIKQGMVDASKQASIGSPTLSPVKGVPTTTTVGPYFDMLKSASPEVATKISEVWNTGGGNNGVKRWLNSAEGQALQKANPQFAGSAARFVEATPSALTQAGRMLRPLAVGAARVAGPVGMAANLYEAAPYLEQAGPELTSGRAKNRMVEAQQMMLSRPTPAPLSPQEASNLLQSDDQRTINIYGGRAHLEALVKSGIRQKAASKVLGPIAPGQ
jgi:hypothetical protein